MRIRSLLPPVRPGFQALLCLTLAAAAPEPAYVPVSPPGGTELRNLVAHDGKLFAANGYWKDTSPDPPGARVLVLDAPGRPWRVDHEFGDRMRGGRRRHLVISALAEARFGTDAHGAKLPAPVSLLLASTWDLTGARVAFVRDDRSGEWTGTQLAQSVPTRDFLPQIRAFGTHRDSVTGADMVFAGDTAGVFAGAYDRGSVRWDTTPELATAGMGADRFNGLTGRLRISSFAEAGHRLFAAVGQQVWVRDDGAAPGWHHVYTNPAPAYSQTGLRGLTAVPVPGKGEALLAAVEGNKSRIVRIDPSTGAEATDLDLAGLLNSAWHTRVSYIVAAYNDMARLPRPDGRGDLLIGFEAFIPPAAPRPAGHAVLEVNHGLEGGGWYLIRHPDGTYDLHQVTASFPGIGTDLVSVRTAVASPFAGESDAFYLGGYDANDSPAHDTAWLARASR